MDSIVNEMNYSMKQVSVNINDLPKSSTAAAGLLITSMTVNPSCPSTFVICGLWVSMRKI
ncbi:unnamed protein product [Trichobilharzia regenti]|nr:unnamed protein product [Trichobilharzia regenti]